MRLPMPRVTSMALLFSVVILATTVGCASAQASSQIEAASSPAVERDGKLVWSGSYSGHVQPIFERSCVFCHGRTGAGGPLKLTSYQEVMRGTRNGAVVTPGSVANSSLISVLTREADPSTSTPHGRRGLSEVELRNIALWIEAGACSD